MGIFGLTDPHLSLSEAFDIHNLNEFGEEETFHSSMVWWSKEETWNLFVVLTCDPSNIPQLIADKDAWRHISP